MFFHQPKPKFNSVDKFQPKPIQHENIKPSLGWGEVG